MAAVAAAPSCGAGAVPRLLLRQVALRRAAPEQQEPAGKVSCADRALRDVAGPQQATPRHAAAQHAATDAAADSRAQLAKALVCALREKHVFELDAAACFAAFGCPALRALSDADEQRLHDEVASALLVCLGAGQAEQAAAQRAEELEDAVRRVGYAAQRAQELLAASEDDLYLGLGAWEAADSAATRNAASEQQEEHEVAGHTLPCFLRALLRELQALMQHDGACSDDDEACEYCSARGLHHTGAHMHAV